MFETKEKLLEAIIKGIPHPQCISDIDLSKEDCVCFTWKETSFEARLEDGGVMAYYEGLLVGNNEAILVQQIIQHITYPSLNNSNLGK